MRIKKRKKNQAQAESSNRVLYILALIVVALIAGALLLRPGGGSEPNTIADEKVLPQDTGAIEAGTYRSSTVVLPLPEDADTITGGQAEGADSFVLEMDDGSQARYQGALLSGAYTPQSLVQGYDGKRVRVAGNPAVLVGFPGSAVLIGTLGYNRFELETTAPSRKAAEKLALRIGELMRPGKGE